MRVKDIILRALIYAGRDDVIKAVEDVETAHAKAQKEYDGEEEYEEDVEQKEGEEPAGDEKPKSQEADWIAELEGDMQDAVKTALLCLNAVEDELARHYLPLKKTEKFYSGSGEIAFASFSEHPIKILSVKSGAGKCKYEVLPEKLSTCAGEVRVEYNFAPRPKGICDDSTYTEAQASLALLAAGTASEFCLLYGDGSASNLWEAKYRREIDLVQRSKYSGLNIPPRRWV